MGFSLSGHKLIVYVVYFLGANILANCFMPWAKHPLFSFVQNFALYVINK